MTDHVNKATRSAIMAAVRSRDTSPEMAVRRLVHGMGYRYVLHAATLPGKPDMVFPSRRKIILIHGCFWHRHGRCRYATTPKTRVDFWEAKFCANVRRDRRVLRQLRALGWSVLTVWQCETRNPGKLGRRLDEYLSQ